MTDIDKAIRLARSAEECADWNTAIKHWQTAVDGYVGLAPKSVRSRLRKAQHTQKSIEALRQHKLAFKAIADAEKPIWVKPQNVTHKVRPLTDHTLYPYAILDGNWDLDIVSIEQTTKYRSLIQHFRDGVDWEDTELFRTNYMSRIARGEAIRRCTTIADLGDKYRKEVDGLYNNMKQHGFVLPADKLNLSAYLPHVHIGRTGEILFGTGGNHRLTIAKILKLDRFACVVRARHSQWQALRERLFDGDAQERSSMASDELVSHPDMADLIG